MQYPLTVFLDKIEQFISKDKNYKNVSNMQIDDFSFFTYAYFKKNVQRLYREKNKRKHSAKKKGEQT